MDDLRLALRAACEAGRAAQASFGGEHDVVYKGPDQPLTAADLEANRALERVLREGRPDYGWLSEETADRADRRGRRRVWIVDPIDGTRSFIRGHPEWAVSVGLAEAGEPTVGVVYNPASAEVFWAVRGGGAWAAAWRPAGDVALDALLERAARLRVSAHETADQARLLASRSEIARGEFDPFHGGWRVLPVGSTAYKMARIATGEGEVFLSRGPKSEWDVCAAALLVEEAGGRATGLDGRPFRFNRADPYVPGVLASNGRLHDYVLGVVASLPPSPRLRRPADPLHPGPHEQEEEE